MFNLFDTRLVYNDIYNFIKYCYNNHLLLLVRIYSLDSKPSDGKLNASSDRLVRLQREGRKRAILLLCAGNVEILHDGKWGSVCDDEWDDLEADVVCRQLGFNSAIKATTNGHFGQARSEMTLLFFHLKPRLSRSSATLARSRDELRYIHGRSFTPIYLITVFLAYRIKLYISANTS